MKALRGMKHLVRVVNYHSMGEVMYCNKKAKGSVGAAIGKMRAKVRALTKYRTIWETSTGKKSGCLSDYIIYKLKVASITLETGRYKCPLAFSQYGRVRSKNKRVIEAMLSLS